VSSNTRTEVVLVKTKPSAIDDDALERALARALALQKDMTPPATAKPRSSGC
jgi:hypothetical protein